MDPYESVYEQLFGELLLVVPLLAIALLGVAIVRSAANRMFKVVAEYGAMPSRCGLPGELVARRLLAICKLNGVKLATTDKQDHYHPWRREVRLNHLTFESPSLAALAVAAHEVGHAEQFAERTLLCRLRNIAWPLCYVLLAIAIVPPAISLFTDWTLPVGDIGTLVLPAALGMLLLQLPIHLPLETDATRRARRMVVEAKLIGENELAGFDRMLSTAWWTHFACDAQRCLVVLLAGGVTLWATHSLNVTELDFDDALALEALDVQVAPQIQPPPVPTVPLPPASQAPLVPPPPFPPQISPSQNSPSQNSPSQNSPSQNSPSQNSPSQNSPSQNSPSQNSPSQISPSQISPSQISPLPPGSPLVFPDEYAYPFSAALLIFDLIYLIVGVGGLVGIFWLVRKLTPGGRRSAPAASTSMDCNNAGFAMLQAGNLDAAVQAFTDALSLEPYYLPALLNRARSYTHLGRLDEAVSDYAAAMLLASDSAMPHERRADIYALRGDFARAIDDYTAVIERDADRATAYRERGLMHYRREEYEEAVIDCNRAIEIDSRLFDHRDAAVFNNRGAAYIKLGEYAQARADLDIAIRLDANFPHAFKNLAWLEATCPAAEFRNGESAVANAKRALSLSDEQVPEWFAVMAAACAEARRFDEAIVWQTRYAENLSPSSRGDAEATIALFESGKPVREQPKVNNELMTPEAGDYSTSAAATVN